MKPIAVSLGRFLIATGCTLTVLVLIETHQKMVDARALSTSVSANALRVEPADSAEARSQRPLANLFRAQTPALTPAPAVPAPTATPAAAPKATAPASTKAAASESEQVAISAGAPGEQAHDLAQVNVAQVARGAWSQVSFPLEQFQAYTSPFGYRRSIEGYSSNEFHYGLDMAAPQGSYIRNWSSGTVVEVSDDSNCGTSVVVESGQWLSIYCHMEGYVESSGGRRYMLDRTGGLQIFEGQQVYAGQRVGRVGMTGRTTGPHLHWGLKFNSNWVDPALVLRAMYSGQETAALPQIIARTEPSSD